MGAERRSMIISDKEKRNTAFHEAGHALVGKLMKSSRPGPQGHHHPARPRARGSRSSCPPRTASACPRDAANDQIAVADGRARRRGDHLRPAHDRRRRTTSSGARDLARRMVCEWGMREKLGPLHFGKREGEVFLGRDFGDTSKDYSEQTAVEIDAEMRTHRHRPTTTAPRRSSSRTSRSSRRSPRRCSSTRPSTAPRSTSSSRARSWNGSCVDAAEKATPAPKAAEKPPRPSIFAPPRPVPDKA